MMLELGSYTGRSRMAVRVKANKPSVFIFKVHISDQPVHLTPTPHTAYQNVNKSLEATWRIKDVSNYL